MSGTKSGSKEPVPAKLPFTFPGKDADSRPLWSEVDSTVVAAMVHAWTNALGAVTFGWTRDGTALALTLYMGDDKAGYIYGQSKAAENALREHTEWAIDWNSRAISFNVPRAK